MNITRYSLFPFPQDLAEHVAALKYRMAPDPDALFVIQTHTGQEYLVEVDSKPSGINRLCSTVYDVNVYLDGCRDTPHRVILDFADGEATLEYLA